MCLRSTLDTLLPLLTQMRVRSTLDALLPLLTLMHAAACVAQRYEVGAPISSAGIGFVQLCGRNVTGLKEGDLVIDPFDGWPWRSDAVIDASRLTRVPQSLTALIPVEQLLANVGLSGLTALHGIRDAGKVRAAFFAGRVAAALSTRSGAAT